MSYPETTTMATPYTFNLPAMDGLDFGNDDLADDMEGLTLSFPKVKIPVLAVLCNSSCRPATRRIRSIPAFCRALSCITMPVARIGPRAVNTMITPFLCAPPWTESRATVRLAAPALPVS